MVNSWEYWSLFSTVKLIKLKINSDYHTLEQCIKISTSGYIWNYAMVSENLECQISHKF